MLSRGPFWGRFTPILRGHFLNFHFLRFSSSITRSGLSADHHTFSSVRRHNSSSKSTGSAPWKAPFFPSEPSFLGVFPVKFPHCWLSFFQHSFHFGLAHTDSHITHLDPLPAQKSVHQSTLWPLNAPKFSQRPFFRLKPRKLEHLATRFEPKLQVDAPNPNFSSHTFQDRKTQNRRRPSSFSPAELSPDSFEKRAQFTPT